MNSKDVLLVLFLLQFKYNQIFTAFNDLFLITLFQVSKYTLCVCGCACICTDKSVCLWLETKNVLNIYKIKEDTQSIEYKLNKSL